MSICTAIITGLPLCHRHGTGAQILRIFRDAGLSFWSLHWSYRRGFVSENAAAARLQNLPRLKRLRGGRVVDAVDRALGTAWWQGDQVNGPKLRRLLSARAWRADVAYVAVANEREARSASSILDQLACPYVLHLWDLCHDEGLDPATMAGYARLLTGAASVLVLSEPMADQVRRFDVAGCEVVRFGQRLAACAQLPPSRGEPVRIVLVGSLGEPGNPAIDILLSAWPRLAERLGQVHLTYLGQHYSRLPSALRQIVEYPGLVSAEAYENVLASSHLAILPSPHRLDCFGRFSLPSRVSDYLMAGLPVLACVAEGTATASFLAPLSPGTVRFVNSAAGLVNAVESFAEPEVWLRANRSAREYAEEQFAIERVRGRIVEHLLAAAEHRVPEPASHLRGVRL